jgi:hypothetical protein
MLLWQLKRDTVFSGGQLHQFPGDGLTDAADPLKEFFSMHISFPLILFCQILMLLYAYGHKINVLQHKMYKILLAISLNSKSNLSVVILQFLYATTLTAN